MAPVPLCRMRRFFLLFSKHYFSKTRITLGSIALNAATTRFYANGRGEGRGGEGVCVANLFSYLRLTILLPTWLASQVLLIFTFLWCKASSAEEKHLLKPNKKPIQRDFVTITHQMDAKSWLRSWFMAHIMQSWPIKISQQNYDVSNNRWHPNNGSGESEMKLKWAKSEESLVYTRSIADFIRFLALECFEKSIFWLKIWVFNSYNAIFSGWIKRYGLDMWYFREKEVVLMKE